MSILSQTEIVFLLDRLNDKTVIESSEMFPYRVSQKERGYSKDPKTAALQAKLSIMLEMAQRAKEGVQ